MEYQEIMAKLTEMRSRYDNGFSFSDRDLLEELNVKLFYKRISNKGCADCYRDAYLIIYNKLKRDKAMPTPSEYRLKKGKVLHIAGTADYYVNDVPAKIAEEHLKLFPNLISEFEHFPEDWEKRIKKGKTTKQKTEQTEEVAPAEEETK